MLRNREGPAAGRISPAELLRVIQFHHVGGHERCPECGTEDGFRPFPTEM